MTFEIEISGRRYIVVIDGAGPIDRTGGRVRMGAQALDADGQAAPVRPPMRDFDLCVTELGVSLLDLAHGRILDAAVTARVGGTALVQLPRVTVEATMNGRRAHAGPDGATSGRRERLTAPMPGRILRVLVQPGEMVAARQGLVVMEAMKMENELSATRAGRVLEVSVVDGALVEAGRVLVVLE